MLRKDLLLVENKYFVPACVKTCISEIEVKAFLKTHFRCTWRNFDSFITKKNTVLFNLLESPKITLFKDLLGKIFEAKVAENGFLFALRDLIIHNKIYK